MEIFKRGMVAIVVKDNEFLGLVTRIDPAQLVAAPALNQPPDQKHETRSLPAIRNARHPRRPSNPIR